MAKRPFVDVDERYVPLQNKGNDYLIDREAQKTTSYTGIKGVRVQDMAVQEDQRGPLSDRTREHLGARDTGVIATRRRLLDAGARASAGHASRRSRPRRRRTACTRWRSSPTAAWHGRT